MTNDTHYGWLPEQRHYFTPAQSTARKQLTKAFNLLTDKHRLDPLNCHWWVDRLVGNRTRKHKVLDGHTVTLEFLVNQNILRSVVFNIYKKKVTIELYAPDGQRTTVSVNSLGVDHILKLERYLNEPTT